MRDVPEPPVFLAPATGHYSWPKAATLLGLGGNALLVQRVDQDARLDLEHVDATLAELLRRRVPVMAAVAVLGSTEESAVDPLAGLLELRAAYRKRGLNFMVHADAAWGGYFRTTLRPRGTPAASRMRAAACRWRRWGRMHGRSMRRWGRRTASRWTRTRAATSPIPRAPCATAMPGCGTW